MYGVDNDYLRGKLWHKLHFFSQPCNSYVS